MKTKLALSLFVAVLVSACSSTKTTTSTTMSSDPKAALRRYDSMEAAPPAEGPEADIPTEGPADVNRESGLHAESAPAEFGRRWPVVARGQTTFVCVPHAEAGARACNDPKHPTADLESLQTPVEQR